MKVLCFIRSLTVSAACVGMLLPVQGVSAVEGHFPAADGDLLPPQPLSVVADVSLAADGVLRGGLLDGDGKPLSETPVLLMHRTSGREYRAVSDPHGRFDFKDLPGGLYQLDASGASLVCRCWAPNTAPPAASKELLMIADERIQRGQRPLMEALYSTPTLLCLMIVAAIAIPIAVHNANRDAS